MSKKQVVVSETIGLVEVFADLAGSIGRVASAVQNAADTTVDFMDQAKKVSDGLKGCYDAGKTTEKRKARKSRAKA